MACQTLLEWVEPSFRRGPEKVALSPLICRRDPERAVLVAWVAFVALVEKVALVERAVLAEKAAPPFQTSPAQNYRTNSSDSALAAVELWEPLTPS